MKRMKFAAVAVASLALMGTTACGSNQQSGDSGGSDVSPAAESAAKDLGIDLSACNSSFTQPIKGDIPIGQSIPLSGSYAALGTLGGGLKAAVEAQNAKGGIDGHKIKLFQTDDQYEPAKTLSATQEFIDKDKVSAVVGTLGTSNALAVEKLVRESCLPYLAAYTGAASVLTAKEAYPWITGGVLSYDLEPRAWVDRIDEMYPEGTTVALFGVNNDAGKEYRAAFKEAMKGSKSTLKTVETYEQGETTSPSSQVTTMKASGAKVVVDEASGSMCATFLTEVANQGWKPDMFTVNGCAPYLSGAGGAADGVKVADWLVNPNDPSVATNAGVTAYKEAMAAYAKGAKIDTFAPAGYVAGEIFIQAAQKAAESDLGLSPLGILYAAHHLDFTPSVTLPKVKVVMDGKTDTVPVETVVLDQYKSGQMKPLGTYSYEGEMTK